MAYSEGKYFLREMKLPALKLTLFPQPFWDFYLYITFGACANHNVTLVTVEKQRLSDYRGSPQCPVEITV
jgi:hypothetical protein